MSFTFWRARRFYRGVSVKEPFIAVGVFQVVAAVNVNNMSKNKVSLITTIIVNIVIRNSYNGMVINIIYSYNQ